MKKYFKLDFHLKKVLKMFIVIFFIGSVALILSSIVPDKMVDKQIEKSVVKMNKEGVYPTIMKTGSAYFRIDNWTEASFLDFIYNCDSNKPLECTYAQYYYTGGKTGLENVNKLIQESNPNFNKEKVGSNILRSSYWLGARIIYRPLLAFIDYQAIRYIIIAIAIFLSIFTIIKLSEKLNRKYAIAFCGSLLITNYFVGLFVSGHVLTYILAFLGMDYLLLTKKKINYFNFMFIIGMLTTYFDWFSIPLITWGFTIITILLKEYINNKEKKFYEYFNIIFQTGLAWCLGYASLLVFRILFSYLVAGSQAISYFTSRVSSNTGVGASLIENVYLAIISCTKGLIPIVLLPISKPISLAIVGILYFISLIACIYLNKKNKAIGWSLLIISLAPFAWIAVFSGFHIIHHWFAYRCLSIFAFAIFSVFMIILEEIIIQLKNSKRFQKWIKKLKKANILRFIMVGGTATLIDYIIYMIISSYINLNISKCISMTCSCIFSFIANKNWTFSVREKTSINMLISYIFVQCVNISINTFTNYLMYSITSIKTLSFVIATFAAMIINYLLQNYFVFKGGKSK